MPADERLRQAGVVDELGHTGRPLGEPSHDPQAIHVGQGLVDDLQVAQIVGLVDDRGQRRADSGRGGTQGMPPAPSINGDLYQRSLMLLPLPGYVKR
jgi:hypothetical protein